MTRQALKKLEKELGWCWLLGHDLRPITDFMTPEEIRDELLRTGGNIQVWTRCARCGYER